MNKNERPTLYKRNADNALNMDKLSINKHQHKLESEVQINPALRLY